MRFDGREWLLSMPIAFGFREAMSKQVQAGPTLPET
jgi:hypothetical protein